MIPTAAVTNAPINRTMISIMKYDNFSPPSNYPNNQEVVYNLQNLSNEVMNIPYKLNIDLAYRWEALTHCMN